MKCDICTKELSDRGNQGESYIEVRGHRMLICGGCSDKFLEFAKKLHQQHLDWQFQEFLDEENRLLANRALEKLRKREEDF